MMYDLQSSIGIDGYSAALYIRLSKEDDNSTTESESVGNQRNMLRDFCKKHRIYVYDEYVDDGYSGGNFDRPGFQRMIGDIEAKHINMVITKDMSRLGRDYIQIGHFTERYFPEKSVRYISLLDGVDTGLDLSANEMTPFRAIFNDMYAKDISKKIKSVKREKQRKGQFIGWKPPYGYRTERENVNQLLVDEVVADNVREIFNLALTGISCRQIAVTLNERGVPTPAMYSKMNVGRKGHYSGKWSAERITFMLKNRVYCGDMVQGRMEKVNYKSDKCRKLPESQWIIVEDTHEPIVSRDEFERVGRLIDSRKKTRSRKIDFPLKGLVYCKECQHPLGVINRVLSGNKPTLYFVCRTYQRFTKNSACTCHCVRVERISQIVVDRIRNICLEYLDSKTAVDVAGIVMQEVAENRKVDAEIKRLTAEISIITAKMDRLYDDRLNGLVEDGDFKRLYDGMKESRTNIQRRLDRLTTADYCVPELDKEIDILVQNFVSSAEANRELLCSLIERIELSDDKQIFIRFRFAPEEKICLQGLETPVLQGF